MDKLNGYHEKGKLLEKSLTRAFDILKIPNNHNHFDHRYNHGFGVDNTISTCRGNIETECKNLKVNGQHQKSSKWIKEEIVSRYGYKPFKKIIVASYLNVSRKLRRWLETHYRLIELGYQVTKHNYNRAVHDLVKKLYYVKIKFSKYINGKPKTKQTVLPNYDCLLYNVVIEVVGFVGLNGSYVSFNVNREHYGT